MYLTERKDKASDLSPSLFFKTTKNSIFNQKNLFCII